MQRLEVKKSVSEVCLKSGGRSMEAYSRIDLERV